MQFRLHFDRSNRSISNDYTHWMTLRSLIDQTWDDSLLAVSINDRLLPGNEIESGGMYTRVKDPVKKGTRGKEDWRGWNEKARREIEIFEIQHTLSLLPFSCSGLSRDSPRSRRETFYPAPLLHLVTFLISFFRDLYYLLSSVALIFVNF